MSESKNPSSLAGLEVERAIGDLRRGEAVKLTGMEEGTFTVAAAEYRPGAPVINDKNHPAVKLMKLAGLLPQAVIEQGGHEGMLSVSSQAIVQYPAQQAASLHKVSEAHVPLPQAEDARIIAYRSRFGHEEHLAVVIGEPAKQKAPLVRVHSSCVTGDVFASLRCDCGSQLHRAMDMITQEKAGVILYLSQEGRGIGIANKLRAYQLQDKGMDTIEANLALGFEADERDFAQAAAIFKDLGINTVTLLTNNPSKIKALEALGITVAQSRPMVGQANKHNQGYLDTKAHKLGHHLPVAGAKE